MNIFLKLASEPSPSKDVYDGELLYNEPKYLKTGEVQTAPDGLPEMTKIGKLKQGGTTNRLENTLRKIAIFL